MSLNHLLIIRQTDGPSYLLSFFHLHIQLFEEISGAMALSPLHSLSCVMTKNPTSASLISLHIYSHSLFLTQGNKFPNCATHSIKQDF